jgi:hypothetical protein
VGHAPAGAPSTGPAAVSSTYIGSPGIIAAWELAIGIQAVFGVIVPAPGATGLPNVGGGNPGGLAATGAGMGMRIGRSLDDDDNTESGTRIEPGPGVERA